MILTIAITDVPLSFTRWKSIWADAKRTTAIESKKSTTLQEVPLANERTSPFPLSREWNMIESWQYWEIRNKKSVSLNIYFSEIVGYYTMHFSVQLVSQWLNMFHCSCMGRGFTLYNVSYNFSCNCDWCFNWLINNSWLDKLQEEIAAPKMLQYLIIVGYVTLSLGNLPCNLCCNLCCRKIGRQVSQNIA